MNRGDLAELLFLAFISGYANGREGPPDADAAAVKARDQATRYAEHVIAARRPTEPVASLDEERLVRVLRDPTVAYVIHAYSHTEEQQAAAIAAEYARLATVEGSE